MTTTCGRGTATGVVAVVPLVTVGDASRQLSIEETSRERMVRTRLGFTGSEQSWTACAAALAKVAHGSWAYVPPIAEPKPKPVFVLMKLFVLPICCRCITHLQRRLQPPEFERGNRFHLVQKSDSFRGEGDPAARQQRGRHSGIPASALKTTKPPGWFTPKMGKFSIFGEVAAKRDLWERHPVLAICVITILPTWT